MTTKNMRASIAKRALLLALAGWCATASATVIYDYTGPDTAIPDANANGVAFNFSYTGDITAIDSMTVTLNISGGWNGDLYIYLTHGDGFAVLVNRIGRTLGSDLGSPISGFTTVMFSDTGANGDIHSAAGSSITGAWEPDGRFIDPASALDTTPRTALLSSFDGLNPDGSWTLFVADLSGGDMSMLTDFSVDVTPVPEPVNVALAIFAGLAVASYAIRRRCSGKLVDENANRG